MTKTWFITGASKGLGRALAEVGGVNRAREVRVTASGKAVNAARVVTTVGRPALVATFLGGDTGRFVARRLDMEGVAHHVVWTEDDAPTRTCITLLPDGGRPRSIATGPAEHFTDRPSKRGEPRLLQLVGLPGGGCPPAPPG